MRIEVKLLAHLKRYLPEADREKSPFFVDVPNNFTIKEIVDSLGKALKRPDSGVGMM